MVQAKSNSSFCRCGLIFAGLLLSMVVVGTSAEGQDCAARQQLTVRPSIIGSAVWAAESRQVVVTDLGEDSQTPARLLIYSPEGELQRVVPDQYKPHWGAQLAGRYVQLTYDAGETKLRRFDESLDRHDEVSLSLSETKTASLSGAKSPIYQIKSIYDAPTIVEGQLFAYGTFTANNLPANGFFRSTLPAANNSQLVPRVYPVMYFGEDNYYTLGNPYITSLGTVAFFLAMDGYAELWAYDMRSDKELPRPMRGYSRELPVLDSNRPPEEVYQELRQHNLPYGLYGQGSFLYILNQKANPDSSLSWSLTQYRPDLKTDRVESRGTLEIPSKASRLVPVPSMDNWYFFERREESDGQQRFSNLLVVPRKSIESRSSITLCGTDREGH